MLVTPKHAEVPHYQQASITRMAVPPRGQADAGTSSGQAWQVTRRETLSEFGQSKEPQCVICQGRSKEGAKKSMLTLPPERRRIEGSRRALVGAEQPLRPRPAGGCDSVQHTLEPHVLQAGTIVLFIRRAGQES
eukprot:5324753-Pleurochrysis_carterae.AAC.2